MKQSNNSYKKSPLFLLLFLLTVIPEAGAKTVYITGQAVHLRSEKSTMSNVVTILRKDEGVEILNENKNWYEVSTNKGAVGWIAKRLVTEELPLAQELRIEKEKNKAMTRKVKQLQGNITDIDKYKKAASEKINGLVGENRRLRADTDSLRSTKDIIHALIGIGIFVIGWFFGFITGFYKKQSDNKRLESMMADTKFKFDK